MKSDFHKKLRDTHGFSLLEIVVVLSIFIFLTLIASDFFTTGLKSNVFGHEQDEAVRNARLAANNIAKELREATAGAAGTYMLETVATNTIAFFADVDNDNYADRIRYFVQGNELMRGLTAPTGTPPTAYNLSDEQITTVADYLNNQSQPVFTYFDATSTPITSPAASINRIRMVHIMMKINVTPERAPADYFYETDVQIRNLKDNL